MSLEGPPEVHEPHSHPPGAHRDRRGPPAWLEWATSISALVVSVSSIVIAIHHGDTMDKLVKANSFPYLIGVASDARPDGRESMSVDFSNNGVGPADEQSLKIKVGDRYVTSVAELVAASVDPEDAPAAVAALRGLHNTVRTRFIAGNGNQFVFRIDKTPANAVWWDKVDSRRTNWRIEYCYCSVFAECWRVKVDVHTPVKACVRDELHEFVP